jgi:phenylalanyl-tRNA synthetase alpha chain
MLPRRPTNIPSSVWSRIGRNLHKNPRHPVGIISQMVESHFGHQFLRSADLPLPPVPIVTSGQAFDGLLVPKDHCLRSTSDTFYVTESRVLRPHATSHQRDVIEFLTSHPSSADGAVWTCDVYRKDEVDRIHFPVFHQTDGIKLFPSSVSEAEIVTDLQASLTGLMGELFHAAQIPFEYRWDHTAFFPFTNPSIEMEIRNGTDWLECLGCGKIETSIHPSGWAFGMGIDRLAMLLFRIEDIRTLWSEDDRFLSQFQEGEITTFKPFSKFPPTYRDVAFWLEGREFDEKIFAFHCMQRAGPYGLESIELVDQFENPKLPGKISRCFRCTYRGIEKTLTSSECNEIHDSIVRAYVGEIGGVVR